MDITIYLQIKIQFDGNKKVSVGNVATAVKGLGLEQKVTEAAIHKADEELIEKCCGECMPEVMAITGTSVQVR
jgi:hypothetical protein